MNMRILTDELYPDYSLYDVDPSVEEWGAIADFSDAEIARIRAAEREYDACQQLIKGKLPKPPCPTSEERKPYEQEVARGNALFAAGLIDGRGFPKPGNLNADQLKAAWTKALTDAGLL